MDTAENGEEEEVNPSDTSDEETAANEPSEEQKMYLSNLTPYDKGSYSTDPFVMDEQDYGNGFKLLGGSYAIWNLGGQYDTLEFDIGHSGHPEYDKTVYIYLDEQMTQTINVKAGDFVTHVTVPLNGAGRLKIDTSYWSWGYIGFANTELS